MVKKRQNRFCYNQYSDKGLYMKIGIIGAMDCEVTSIRQLIVAPQTEKIAKLDFTFGVISEVSVVVVVCGIGKVNAAIGTNVLINHFDADCIINIGVAGAADESLNTGDIVISKEATYHDYDSRQLVYTYPNLINNIFSADIKLSEMCFASLSKAFRDNNVFMGRVVTGDRFIADFSERNKIRTSYNASCLDCEGAAIAHASYANNIPFVLIKVISDKADEKASISFREFLKHVPGITREIFLNILNNIY